MNGIKNKKKYFNTIINMENIDQMSNDLNQRIKLIKDKKTKDLLFLGIGTNNHLAFWDHFGPMVGTLLKNNGIKCYGAMNKPIHALNFNDFINSHQKELNDYIIIVLDSALSVENKLGQILIQTKGIEPGRATKKHLSKIGDISICAQTNLNFLYGDPDLIENEDMVSTKMLKKMVLLTYLAILKSIKSQKEEIDLNDSFLEEKLRILKKLPLKGSF